MALGTWQCMHLTFKVDIQETFREASTLEKASEAETTMEEKMGSLKKNGTWNLVKWLKRLFVESGCLRRKIIHIVLKM